MRLCRLSLIYWPITRKLSSEYFYWEFSNIDGCSKLFAIVCSVSGSSWERWWGRLGLGSSYLAAGMLAVCWAAALHERHSEESDFQRKMSSDLGKNASIYKQIKKQQQQTKPNKQTLLPLLCNLAVRSWWEMTLPCRNPGSLLSRAGCEVTGFCLQW